MSTSESTNVFRQLLRADGTARQGVLAVLVREDTGARVGDLSTDDFGQFDFDTTLYADGTYHLEYFGDGILPTVFDADGNKAQEDSQTPWEYEIYIKNANVFTRSQTVFRSLVFKKSTYYPEFEDGV